MSKVESKTSFAASLEQKHIEGKKHIYATFRTSNTNNINPNPINSDIINQSTDILKNEAQYKACVSSLTINVGEVAFRNMFRDVNWNPNNFYTNATNQVVGIGGPAGTRTFTLPALPPPPAIFNPNSSNNLLIGFNVNANGSLTYVPRIVNNVAVDGLMCCISYQSGYTLNGLYPDPLNVNGANSSSYPLQYWDVNEVDQYCLMINSAFSLIMSKCTGIQQPQPPTQTLNMDWAPKFGVLISNGNYSLELNALNWMTPTVAGGVDVPLLNYKIYCNEFFQIQMDGFNWIQRKDPVDVLGSTDINGNFVATQGYIGADYELNLTAYANKAFNYYIPRVPTTGIIPAGTLVPPRYKIVSEKNTIVNLSDIHSILITCDQSLAGLRQQYIPVNSGILNTNNTSQPLLQKPVIRNLDLNLNGGNLLGLDNPYVSYEAITFDHLIDFVQNSALNSFNLYFYAITNIGDVLPIYLRAGASCQVTVVFIEN